MSVTYCVGPVERELRAHKAITSAVLRGIAAQQPTTCNRPDCTPGGCRAHVIEFLSGVALRAGLPVRRGK